MPFSSSFKGKVFTRQKRMAVTALGITIALGCAATGVAYASVTRDAQVAHGARVAHGCYEAVATSTLGLKLVSANGHATCPANYATLTMKQGGGQSGAATQESSPQWAAETYRVQGFENLYPGETVTLTPLCHSGDVVIGGFTRADGVTALSGDERYAAIAPIGPAPAAQGWTATATGRTYAPDFLDVFAVCLVENP
jgi:hypothetical protein